MRPLRPEPGQPTLARHNVWVRMEDGSQRSGNVLIRNDGPDNQLRADWRIYLVTAEGRLVRVHPKSRPWGYGHPGQAKVGVAHILHLLETDRER